MSYVRTARRVRRRPMALGLVKRIDPNSDGQVSPDLLTGTTGVVKSQSTAGELVANNSPGTVAATQQDISAQTACTGAGGTYQVDANLPCMSACETAMRQQCVAAGGVFTLLNRTQLNAAKGQYFMAAQCQTPTGAIQLGCAPLNSAASCAGQGGSFDATTGDCGVTAPVPGQPPPGGGAVPVAVSAGPSLMTMLLLGVAGVAAVVLLRKRKKPATVAAPVPVA